MPYQPAKQWTTGQDIPAPGGHHASPLRSWIAPKYGLDTPLLPEEERDRFKTRCPECKRPAIVATFPMKDGRGYECLNGHFWITDQGL